jgi:hypothetical protein
MAKNDGGDGGPVSKRFGQSNYQRGALTESTDKKSSAANDL